MTEWVVTSVSTEVKTISSSGGSAHPCRDDDEVRPVGMQRGTSPTQAGCRCVAEDAEMERERWVCDFCGARGRTEQGQPSGAVLCPTCGEPVTREGW